MSRQQVAVTVIIPAYNAEAYLQETLLSLQAQTFQDWEAVLVDDGSTDDTWALASRFAAREPRLHLIRQENRGVSAARNRAIATARGQHLAFLDADDVWLPEKLERQWQMASQPGAADLVYCDICHYESGRVQAQNGLYFPGRRAAEELVAVLAQAPFIYPSGAMVRRNVLLEIGGFDESLQASEDWDLWLRFAIAGYAAQGMTEALVWYRVHPAGLSKRWRDCFMAQMALFPRYFTPDRFPRQQRRKPYRLSFRNSFTHEGGAGRYDGLKEMFDAYRPHDADGYACRIMRPLRHVLPAAVFWFVCRYGVIPLAWHLEALGEKLEARHG